MTITQHIAKECQQKREFVFAFYETIRQKEKEKQSERLHGRRERGKGVGEPAKAETR